MTFAHSQKGAFHRRLLTYDLDVLADLCLVKLSHRAKYLCPKVFLCGDTDTRTHTTAHTTCMDH